MADIVLKRRDGTPVTHEGVQNGINVLNVDGTEALYVDSADVPALLENVPINPDFSNGDQYFTAPDGMAVKSAIVQKPANLIPDFIANGVNIAGVIGTMVAGGKAVINSGEFTQSGVSQIINHGLGEVPDIMACWCKDTASISYTKSKTYFALSLSARFMAMRGITVGHITVACNSNGALDHKRRNNAIEDFVAAGLYNGDADSVVFIYPDANQTYEWVAIGGLI